MVRRRALLLHCRSSPRLHPAVLAMLLALLAPRNLSLLVRRPRGFRDQQKNTGDGSEEADEGDTSGAALKEEHSRNMKNKFKTLLTKYTRITMY